MNLTCHNCSTPFAVKQATLYVRCPKCGGFEAVPKRDDLKNTLEAISNDCQSWLDGTSDLGASDLFKRSSVQPKTF